MPIEALEGFWRGLMQPILMPSHALALAGLGLLIGRQRADRRVVLLGSFVLALIAGLGALALGVGETPAGNILLAGVAISGAITALALALPTWSLVPIALVIGAALGLDSPPDVISLTAAYLMLIGAGLAATIGLGLVSEGSARLRRGWQLMGVRVLGSWAAASALLALAVRYAAGV
jgi:hypothetical protein